MAIFIVIVIIAIAILLMANSAKKTEERARNNIFDTLNLSNMTQRQSIFDNTMMQTWSNGFDTVVFVWDDALRVPANRGREPSFTEPIILSITYSDGTHRSYYVENAGNKAYMRMEQQ